MEDAASRGKSKVKQGGLRLRGLKVPRLMDLWTRVLSGPALLPALLQDRESDPCLWSFQLGKEINQWPRVNIGAHMANAGWSQLAAEAWEAASEGGRPELGEGS